MENNSIKKVYLDQNIFADLIGRVAYASEFLSKICDSIKQKRLIVVPSIELFEELVPVAQSDAQQFKRRWRLIYELVDWSYALKPADSILRDDFINFAESGTPDDPFITKKSPNYSIIRNLADMREPPSVNELQEITQQIHQRKGCFRQLINKAGNGWYGKTKYPKNFTFAEYWKESISCNDYSRSFPLLMVSDLADFLNVGDKCRSMGLAKLLSFPTILLPIGYWAHSWFDQVTKGSKEKASSVFDFRHCTLAGAVGVFVTGDSELRNAIKEIPGHSIKVLSLPELAV